MLVDVSRKCEDTFDSGCFGPSNWADDSITWPEEPKATEETAENVLACELSPLLENPGEKASRLLFWEFKLPLYVECDAEDTLLQISWTQAQCYESPREKRVSHTFKHLISNIKLYNRGKI